VEYVKLVLSFLVGMVYTKLKVTVQLHMLRTFSQTPLLPLSIIQMMAARSLHSLVIMGQV